MYLKIFQVPLRAQTRGTFVLSLCFVLFLNIFIFAFRLLPQLDKLILKAEKPNYSPEGWYVISMA